MTDDQSGAAGDGSPAVPAAVSAPRPRRRGRFSAFWSAVLITLACLLAPLSVLSGWAADVIGDTDRYVATVAPLARNPDVQQAVADRTATALMSRLGLSTLAGQVSPADRPRLAALLQQAARPVEQALTDLVHDTALRVTRSAAFATVWTNANRAAHDAAVKALTGNGSSAVQLTDDAVVIDLAPVIDQVKQQLAAAGLTVVNRLPEIHTDFTVARSPDIGRIKTAFRLLQFAGNWLPLTGLVLALIGVLLAARRRRALVALALGVAGAALVLLIGISLFRGFYLSGLPDSVSAPAAAAVYDALVRFLRSAARTVIVLGVVLGLAAWLSGRGRYAVATRALWYAAFAGLRTTARRFGLRLGPLGRFVHRAKPALTWILLAAAALALALWPYPTGWVIFGLALAVLCALAVLEFCDVPDERDRVPGGVPPDQAAKSVP